MNKHFKYDPEDIESLMLAKSFEELLPEERVFVLKHLSSEREYESMRHLLLESMSVLQSDQPEPPQDFKEEMMAKYRSHHERNVFGKIWLNFFTPLWTGLVERPYLSLAMASVVLFLGVFFWMDAGETTEMALKSDDIQTKKVENERQSQPLQKADPIQPEEISEAEDLGKAATPPENSLKQGLNDRNSGSEKLKERSELSQPALGSADDHMSESDAYVAEDQERIVVEQESASSYEDAARNAAAPTPAVSSAVEATALSEQTKADSPGKAVINEELFALLYTAR